MSSRGGKTLEDKKNKGGKMVLPSKDLRDLKDKNKEPKDAKDLKGFKSDKENKDMKDKDMKDKEKAKFKDMKDMKENKDLKGSKDVKDPKDPKYKSKEEKEKGKEKAEKEKDQKEDKYPKEKDTKEKEKEKAEKEYKEKNKEKEAKEEKAFKVDKGGKDDKKKEKMIKDEKMKAKAVTTSRNRSKRAGLIFPVVRVAKELKQIIPNKARIQNTSSVYLTAVMEYVMAELLEIAGNTAKSYGKRRINPRHLMLSIKNDDELNTLIRATIAGGGVVPDARAAETAANLRNPAKSKTSAGPKLQVFQDDDMHMDLMMPPSKKQKTQAFPPGTPAMGQPNPFTAGFSAPSHLAVPQNVPMVQGGKKQIMSGFASATLGGGEGMHVEKKKKAKVAQKMQLQPGAKAQLFNTGQL